MATLAIIAALLLGTGSLAVSRALSRLSTRSEQAARSFGGGVALAFVFLDLFVELAVNAEKESRIHHIVRMGPEPIHTFAAVVLFGTMVFLVADVTNARAPESWRTYLVAVVPQALNRVLIGAALVEEAHGGARAIVVFAVAMLLHFGIDDHRLVHEFPLEHRAVPRAIFSLAPLAGAGIWLALHPGELVAELLLALISGSLLVSAFRGDLPPARDVRLAPLTAGALAFAALVEIRWWF